MNEREPQPLVRRPLGDLTAYHPERGLRTIAVAEAAEKHFRRAKDATRLMEAVEIKLTEQRNFVLWWDGTGERRGNPNVTGLLRLEDLGLERMTLHRWRSRLKSETGFLKALEAAQARCIRVCEADKGQTDQRGASGTNVNEWYTPPEYVEAARDVLGAIDLDPATSEYAQTWIQAAHWFTKADDGLAHAWPGRVWLNPPYMQPDIALFIEKLCVEVEDGHTTEAVLLTHNYTDTAWFHRAAGVCAAICFTRGRVAFINADGDAAAPTQGQAFFYFGARPDAFRQRFGVLGFVVTPA